MKQYYLAIAAVCLMTSSASAQNFNKAKLDSLLDLIAANNKGMGSLALSKNGKIIYSKAIGSAEIKDSTHRTAATTKTKYRVGSISKMFTAVLIFQLIEEKKLSLNTKLDAYFPIVPDASKISIEQLLGHHSGIHNFTNDSIYSTYFQQPVTHDQLVKIFASNKSDFEPGSKGEYSNTNFVLLGFIAEKITGKLYPQLIKERITNKLKLTDTYVGGKTDVAKNESYSYSFVSKWEQEPETDMSVPAGAGSIVSTPTDLTTFIYGLFTGKLIADSNVKKMQNIRDGYGLAMFKMPFYEKSSYGHGGNIDGFGSLLGYFPEDSVAYAYCGNGQGYSGNDIALGTLSTYFNRPFNLPSFSKVGITAEELDQYLGVYSSTAIPIKITITKDKNVLMAQATGQSAFPLEPTAKHVFTFDRAGIQLTFNPEKKEMTLKQGGSYVFTKE